ncbi:MAG: hypothetical protein BWK78_03415 [Thiotrichaceae bacterium IS1]|nr:MAG: hypothetical protein BWK78_03415 [Thiotrichaceae bacterium IS1]
MLYALTLAGFVFLFVTFFHFFYERLTSPANNHADELELYTNKRMDLYVSLFLSGLLFLWLYDYFPANIYSVTILVISIPTLIFSMWNIIADKISSSKLVFWWREQRDQKDWVKFGERVGLDVIVGTLMAVIFLQWLHEYPFLSNPEDASMDFAMQINQCDEGVTCSFPGKDKKRVPPNIVLLNIDDETYDKWGKPLLTPRKYLKQLIESVANDGARLIVVDVFLSQKTPTDGGLGYSDDELHLDDQELGNYLARYGQRSCGDKECPPIVLIRNSKPKNTKSDYFGVDEWPVSEMRPSFLDEIMKPSSPTSLIQWASPVFWISQFDGHLRRWWLWRPVCENGKPKFIPSVELLVASLASREDKDYKTALTELDHISSKEIDRDFVEQTSCPPTYEPKPLPKSIFLGDGNLEIKRDELRGGGVSQRIMFVMPWRGQSSRVIRVPAKFGSEDRYLTILPAYHYLKGSILSPISYIKDSVVIIGNSHYDTTDRHETPLGGMPGMLVLANGIYSLFLNGGQIESLGLKKAVAEFLLLLIFGLGVALINLASSPKIAPDWWRKRFGYWPAMFIVTGIIGGFLIFSSSRILRGGVWPWNEGGVWVDFSLPLVAIFFHHIVTRFHDLGKTVKEATTNELEAIARETDVREMATKMEKEKLVCQDELHKCKQDNTQLLLELQKSSKLRKE